MPRPGQDIGPGGRVRSLSFDGRGGRGHPRGRHRGLGRIRIQDPGNPPLPFEDSHPARRPGPGSDSALFGPGPRKGHDRFDLLPFHLQLPVGRSPSRVDDPDARRRRRGGLERGLVLLELALPRLAPGVPERDSRPPRLRRDLLRRHELGVSLGPQPAPHRRLPLLLLPRSLPQGNGSRAAGQGGHGLGGFQGLRQLALRKIRRSNGPFHPEAAPAPSRRHRRLQLLLPPLRQSRHRLDDGPPAQSHGHGHQAVRGGRPRQHGAGSAHQDLPGHGGPLRHLAVVHPDSGGLRLPQRALSRALLGDDLRPDRGRPRRRFGHHLPRCRRAHPLRRHLEIGLFRAPQAARPTWATRR